jgi:hypothetical protein
MLPTYCAVLGWNTFEELEYLGRMRAVMAFVFSWQANVRL